MSDPATKQDIHEAQQATKIDTDNIQREIELYRKELKAALLDMKLGVIQALKAALFKIVGLLGGLATLLFLLDKLF